MAAETKEFKASHRFARISPRKARSVIDLIRGKYVEDALTTLRFSQRRASPMISKVVQSAVANAAQEAGVESDDLVVWRAFVDDGPREHRWRPRAQGRIYPRVKRRCHLSVVLKEVPKPKTAPRKGGTAATEGDSQPEDAKPAKKRKS